MSGETKKTQRTPGPGPCPYIYPSFMSAMDMARVVADDAFADLAGRWANDAERRAYSDAIRRGEGPASAGYAVARAAIEGQS